MILVQWIGHALAAAWMVVAGPRASPRAGSATAPGTSIPSTAGTVFGLLWLAVAIVLAASIWWGMDNLVGRSISAFVHGAAGAAPG